MPTTSTRLRVPRHVVVTASAARLPHTGRILERCAAAGVTDVEVLRSDRLAGLRVRGADGEENTSASARRDRQDCATTTTVGPTGPSAGKRSSAVGRRPASSIRATSCSGRHWCVVHCTGMPP